MYAAPRSARPLLRPMSVVFVFAGGGTLIFAAYNFYWAVPLLVLFLGLGNLLLALAAFASNDHRLPLAAAVACLVVGMASLGGYLLGGDANLHLAGALIGWAALIFSWLAIHAIWVDADPSPPR